MYTGDISLFTKWLDFSLMLPLILLERYLKTKKKSREIRFTNTTFIFDKMSRNKFRKKKSSLQIGLLKLFSKFNN